MDEIEDYLNFLEEIMPENLIIYKKDLKTKAACERYCEKIIESVVDLAFLVFKKSNSLIDGKIPENDYQVFDLLSKNKIISEELAEKLKDAKGMRNILAHQYGKVDDEIIFESITNELINDVADFIKSIKRLG